MPYRHRSTCRGRRKHCHTTQLHVMDVTDPRIAASMLSILMAIANIGSGVGLAVSGRLVDTIG
jgi:hypothetical protein